jgi:oligoribonuclease NrnB/cAMP/cGMP phosphodiesterase (DHH superfamily)
MTRPLCIYHGNCADGFSAAWIVFTRFMGQVDFHSGVYGDPPPDVTGRNVILVDFSYKRPVLEEMLATAANILILDHHKTAQEDLSGLPVAAPWAFHVRAGHDDIAAYGGPRMAAIFDMNRSGAMIAWDYFFPGMDCPPLLHHIQDRDLWLFKLEGTREIQANVFSYPYDFKVWDKLMAADPQILRAEGAAIERKHHKDVAELVGVTKRRMVIGGHNVPVANLPYTLASDAGHLMGKGEPFAATYYDKDGARVFGLRSAPDGLDVSEIAKGYGGGGHKHAAGFTAPAGWEGDQ